ncbi:MAG: D-alanyl-D-alanine carboxypeptidase/D-alanyl-D-alanine-endopeptidase [Acidobacteria bacterium]|nr:MAG: D-alanyl-D-alanine carboxypeptidase/D-alanyl-D-alanine-endopeptidase [Acidobacteriota bacterium]
MRRPEAATRLALAGALGALALGAVPAAAREPAGTALQRAVDGILDRPAFAGGFWAAEVRSFRTGRVLYARNADKNMKPASTAKLVTTAAALDAFGPDDRLRTTLETAGRLDGLGRILGDVYLVGRGDPNLSGRFTDGRITAAFEELADALRGQGVRRIEGRLVGHEGLFKGDRRGDDWAWGDLVWWYGAEVSALAFNDNSADLRVSAGERVGEPVLVERNPVSSYYQVVSTATTSPAGTASDLRVDRPLGANVIRISGSFPLGLKPWENSVALEDPARYAATVFSEVLASRGIVVARTVETSSDPLPAGLRVLAGHDGPPLSEVLKGVNKPSQNLHAEMLLRLLGARLKGDGTVESGQAAVEDFLLRVGVHPERWSLQDGSGLSRSDILSAHEMVSLLAAMGRHRYADAFRASLPVAGVDGTLKNRMKGTAAEGRVRAKTGTIRHVNALGGYVDARSGERLVFYIVANHNTAPASEVTGAMDEVCRVLVGR